MLRFVRTIGPAYLRFAEGIRRIETEGMQTLADEIEGFQRGDQRLIILFRHVAKEDAPVMMKLITDELPNWCAARGRPLTKSAHAHFLYGKDVLNWAVPAARWLFPRIGGIPLVNTRVDRESQSTLRRLLSEGDFPLCLAPEGQVTYHAFRTAPLAAGTATLAAWAARDLRARGDERPVRLLPVALGYLPRHDIEETAWALLRRFNGELDRRGDSSGDLDAELVSATEALADFMEACYATEYPGLARFSGGLELQARLDRLVDTVLACGEAVFGWEAAGTPLERIFRLRYRIMESLYREDVDPDGLSPMERERADYQARTASLVKRHEETADILEYLRPDYLEGPGSLRRLEYALNLLDVLNRMRGGNIDTRYTCPDKTALVRVGTPVVLSEPPGRRELAGITRRLTAAFEELGDEMEREVEARRRGEG